MTSALENVPQEMVVVLPNVETFSVFVPIGSETTIYDITRHISCPSARHTSLTHEVDGDKIATGLEIFPTSASLNTIIHQ
jgi:hypothetical protein